MSNEPGRNDLCPCGSGKKYKHCHLASFYPKDYFETEINAFELVNRIQSRLPPEIVVGDVKIYASDPMPWDEELARLLRPLNEIKWDQNDRWHKYVKGRINKLHHKLNALQFHSTIFKNQEKVIEKKLKNGVVGTSYNIVIDEPVLIYTTESFLFQSKSCLDVIAQLIANIFKLTGVSTYEDKGKGLIDKIGKNPLKNYPIQCKDMKSLIQENTYWIKYLVDMRDEVTHYSDLEGVSCFLQSLTFLIDSPVKYSKFS